jgi:hypothetical protein
LESEINEITLIDNVLDETEDYDKFVKKTINDCKSAITQLEINKSNAKATPSIVANYDIAIECLNDKINSIKYKEYNKYENALTWFSGTNTHNCSEKQTIIALLESKMQGLRNNG